MFVGFFISPLLFLFILVNLMDGFTVQMRTTTLSSIQPDLTKQLFGMLVPYLPVVATATSEQGHQPTVMNNYTIRTTGHSSHCHLSFVGGKSLQLIPFSLAIILSQKYENIMSEGENNPV